MLARMSTPTFAINAILPADGSVPDWIELLPSGPSISGRDGRSWTLSDPNAIVRAFRSHDGPIPIDWEHASEVRAPNGLDAPAAGWITEMEVRDGAVWGRAEWTAPAASQIGAKQYRFLSPVFTYSKADNQIMALLSAGLTNQPNIKMTALNREESPMPLPKAVCTALSIPDDATEGDAICAISKLSTDLATATNRAESPPLEKFVPRADYDATLARAANAEAKIGEMEKAAQHAEIESLIDGALKARKIVPATADYYRAMCTKVGTEEFKKFVEVAPDLLPDSGLDGKALPISKSMNRAEFEALPPADRAEFLKARGKITD